MNVLLTGNLPDTLKRVDVTPIFKKGNDNEKENYHPVSMLSTFFQKSLESYYLNKLMIMSKVNSQSILQVFAKTTVLKILCWL